ncbi:Na+/H+ antiporter NhaA [Cellulomonas wangsupingiae]|uniref:Na(+)/H(+) antiporter NhaA n=1 Tax=Cellulomonas wangsupingiae TaxID=2968085 RepID=A0ABY5K156_9CELL|nr:Na+/H+ antiporter NhaA [Cellulomonas wangsupingiae]MCC2335740.1 Na+/H+ antiporter NhaA [Cellulomonas wangsupingiae]UUI63974.1 Na+/H+ antiporter NhaA [Cellulomonas wangsupingiae]
MVTVAPALRTFLATEAGSAVVLLVTTLTALVWANSPWRETYTALWHTTAGVFVGDARLELDLQHWVNDLAMAVFFAVVGLEINREATRGELRDPRAVAVPALGALGGLLVPVLIFLALNAGTDAAHGWGVVMSTDTAFLVGVLALFGPRCPDRLRLFLLTLAIVDDIGAIAAMAVFYTDDVDLRALVVAAVLVAVLVGLRRRRVWRLAPYVGVGVALWVAVLASGVHATIAGVLVGLLVPTSLPQDRRRQEVAVRARRFLSEGGADRGHAAAVAGRAAVATGDRLQRALHPWSAYVVVPLFGLANAGVRLDAATLADAFGSRLTVGTAVALVVGNAVGITGAATLALRLGLGDLPGRVRWGHLVGGAVLAGIGFTISLFIAQLAFDDPVLLERAKIGVLAGSLVAAVAGSLLLRWLGERLPLCTPPRLPPTLPPLPWRTAG